MNPSNLSLRQKSRGTVVKTIAIHLYGARDPNYIVDLTLSNLLCYMTSQAEVRSQQQKITCGQFLTLPYLRRALFVSIALHLAQQLSGIVGVSPCN